MILRSVCSVQWAALNFSRKAVIWRISHSKWFLSSKKKQYFIERISVIFFFKLKIHFQFWRNSMWKKEPNRCQRTHWHPYVCVWEGNRVQGWIRLVQLELKVIWFTRSRAESQSKYAHFLESDGCISLLGTAFRSFEGKDIF